MGKNSFVAEVTFKFTMTVISKAHDMSCSHKRKFRLTEYFPRKHFLMYPMKLVQIWSQTSKVII